MNVNPGELNKSIEIVKIVSKKDNDGFKKTSTELVRKCSAAFNRVSGTENVKCGGDFTVRKCRFLIRHSSTNIDRNMMVVYKGKSMEIKYINNYGDRNEYVEIWCEEITNGV